MIVNISQKSNGKYSDQQLIEGIYKQDTKVLEYIYKHYYSYVERYVCSNKGTIADAKDILQKTTIVIYTMIKKISDGEFVLQKNFLSLFMQIARNSWIDELRRKKRYATSYLEEYPYEFLSDDDNHYLMYELTKDKILSNSIKKLSKRCQKIVLMHIEKKNNTEIAEKLKIKSVNYAKKIRYECLKKLIDIAKKEKDKETLDDDMFFSDFHK